jgi:hypothetical protein
MCSEDPGFLSIAHIRHRVVVGRVLEVGRPHSIDKAPDVAYVDIEVASTIKGPAISSRIRVWDGYHATSCAGALSGMVAGTVVAVALSRADDPPSKAPDPTAPAITSGLGGHQSSPGPDDFFVGGCGTQWQVPNDGSSIDTLRRKIRSGIQETPKSRPSFPIVCSGAGSRSDQAPAPLLTVVESESPVVVATIQSYLGKHRTEPGMPDAMAVQVKEVLQGSFAPRQIRVRVNEGLCPPFVAEFPIGTSWVLHLYRGREHAGEYTISSFGEHWLPIENGRVRGYIVQGPNSASEITMELSELRWRFQEMAAGRRAMEQSWEGKTER